jgi:hypothetical protein
MSAPQLAELEVNGNSTHSGTAVNGNGLPEHALTAAQKHQLQIQILAYKCLARREPLPEALHYSVVYNKPLTSDMQKPDGRQLEILKLFIYEN